MTLDDLVAIHEISALKYRYLRTVDQKDWDGLTACLTEDATASFGGGAMELGSRADIMTFMESLLGRTTILSCHRVSQPEIEVTGADEATGTWALEDKIIDLEHGFTISGAAYYTDRYRRVDGAWLIAHTGYKRMFEEIFPRASIENLMVTAHWWDTDGRSMVGAAPT